MKHKTSFCFSELGTTGGRVLLDDDGLAARTHVAVDLVADLDPKISMIPEIKTVDTGHSTTQHLLLGRGNGSGQLADPVLAGTG